jgi:hypothetical protein
MLVARVPVGYISSSGKNIMTMRVFNMLELLDLCHGGGVVWFR